MENKLLHILIVWSKGYSNLNEIVSDISSSFDVLNIFEISWEKKLFHENLKRFYAHSQMDKKPLEFDMIIREKIKLCGDNTFTMLVFQDLNPLLEYRKTSSGENLVNINVFDKKKLYREQMGGGHKVHASDNYFETKKDLALLLNTDIEKYFDSYQPSLDVIKRETNIVGVPYWKSIDELFFILNSCVNYVVLRNFESLPDNYFVNTHGDIDLLVENYNYVKYLTGSIESFPDLEYRVYNYIVINNEKVPFDFRYLGDNYYDRKWQNNILNSRIFNLKGFYTPNSISYFYSLLYHAYIQKDHVSDDYKMRLSNLASQLKIPYHTNTDLENVLELMLNFLQTNVYQFSVPKDLTVYFNKKNVEYKTYRGFGDNKLIASSTSRTASESFLSEVYDTGDSIIKIASKPINENEYVFLTKLEKFGFSPKVLDFSTFQNYDRIEIEKISTIPLQNISNSFWFWKKKTIIKIVHCAIEILIRLLQENIMHRDIRPDNLLLTLVDNSYNLKLIDFGWAVNITEQHNSVTPFNLGSNFKYPNKGFSDAFSMGRFLLHVFGNLTITKDLINELTAIGPNEYEDKLKLIEKLKTALIDFDINSAKNSFSNELLYWKIKGLIGRKRIRQFRKFFKNDLFN